MPINSPVGKSQKGAFALLVLAGLCLLPFLCLAFYAHSFLDDFMLPRLILKRGLWSQVLLIYQGWSGKFAAHLSIGLHPLTWGSLHEVKPFVFGFIVFFVSCLLYAGHALLQGHRVPLVTRLAAGSLVLTPLLVMLGSPVEAFYWIVSALQNMGGCACCFILLGLIATLQDKQKLWRRRILWALAGLLAFLAPGFTEVISCFVLALLLVLLPLIWRREIAASWLVLLALAVVASALATLAPGNFVRHGGTATLPLIRSVVLAGVSLTYTMLNWFGNGLLILLTLLVLPALERLVRMSTLPLTRLTQRVWFWPIWILVGLFLSHVFCYLALGEAPPSRVRNVLLAFLIVGWFMSVAGLLAYRTQASYSPLPGLPAYARVAVIALVVLLLTSDHNIRLQHDLIGRPTNSVGQAYRDWLSGDAQRYDQDEEARYALIQTTKGEVVELPPLRVRPITLCWFDLSPNAELWGNQAYAAYFKKKKIWVKQE